MENERQLQQNEYDYLCSMYGNVDFNNINEENLTTIPLKDYKIWFMWWQGFNEMPFLVKRCYDQLIKSCDSKFNVVFIDKSNYSLYIDVPLNVLECLNSGTLLMPNFSDFIRFSLLEKYGGLWTDATVFYSDYLNNHFDEFYKPFYSIKNYNPKSSFISNDLWQASFHGTNIIGNPLYKFGKSIFLDFINRFGGFRIFFFVDVVFAFLYNHCNYLKTIVDSLETSVHCFSFFSANPYDEADSTVLNRVLSSGFVHKLSWKKIPTSNTHTNISILLNTDFLSNKINFISIREDNDNYWKKIVLSFRDYITARIDLKMFYVNELSFSVTTNDSRSEINLPQWFNRDGLGYCVHSFVGQVDININVHKGGTLKIYLRGEDRRDECDKSKRVLYYLDYTSFLIDDVPVFNDIQIISHDTPYIHTIKVNTGDVICLRLSWVPHVTR